MTPSPMKREACRAEERAYQRRSIRTGAREMRVLLHLVGVNTASTGVRGSMPIILAARTPPVRILILKGCRYRSHHERSVANDDKAPHIRSAHTYRDESRSRHFDLPGGAGHPWSIDLVTVTASGILLMGFGLPRPDGPASLFGASNGLHPWSFDKLIIYLLRTGRMQRKWQSFRRAKAEIPADVRRRYGRWKN
jgi:hypothetical protein